MLPVTPRTICLPAMVIFVLYQPNQHIHVSAGATISARSPRLRLRLALRAPALPPSAYHGLRLGRLLGFAHAVTHLGLRDLLEGGAGGLLPLRVDLGHGAAIELAGALGGEHHQEIAVRDLVERLLQGRE